MFGEFGVLCKIGIVAVFDYYIVSGMYVSILIVCLFVCLFVMRSSKMSLNLKKNENLVLNFIV